MYVFSYIYNEKLYINLSLDFRVETIDGVHYFIISNSGVPWAEHSYNTLNQAKDKMAQIKKMIGGKQYHFNLDQILK